MRFTLMTVAILSVSLQANAAIEPQLSQCSSITDNTARLHCYDKLAAEHASTAATVSAPAASTTHVAPAKNTEDSFGLEAKRVPENSLDKLELEVVSTAEDPHGALKVTFTNGQIWKQTDGRKYTLKAGEKVYIQKAALGSFLMGTPERNALVRVKRLQ